MRWQDDYCKMHDCSNKLDSPDSVFCIEHDRSRFVPCELCGGPTVELDPVWCEECFEAERQITRIASTKALRALMLEALRTKVST